jgi:hypothetical protein
MGLTVKKYAVSVIFCHKLTFFGKTEGTLLNFEPKFNFLKHIKIYIHDHYV